MFPLDQLSFVQNVTNAPVAASDLPVGARFHQFWETWEALGHKNLHPSVPDVTNLDKVTDQQKWLCRSSQEQLHEGGITCTNELQ